MSWQSPCLYMKIWEADDVLMSAVGGYVPWYMCTYSIRSFLWFFTYAYIVSRVRGYICAYLYVYASFFGYACCSL
jgi:hypothetical protein